MSRRPPVTGSLPVAGAEGGENGQDPSGDKDHSAGDMGRGRWTVYALAVYAELILFGIGFVLNQPGRVEAFVTFELLLYIFVVFPLVAFLTGWAVAQWSRRWRSGLAYLFVIAVILAIVAKTVVR